MTDKNILYENLRYYKIRLMRTDDEDEKSTLQAAIGRTTARIDRIKTDEVRRK
jgi:hypothetical protein